MNSETNFVSRRRVDLVRRADLHQLAVAHDADAVAHHHRLFEAVGDVDEGLVRLAVDVLQLLLERLPELVVDRRERLVEEQDLRVVGEGAGERDALPLAARALRHALAVIVLRQAQQRASARARALPRRSAATPFIFSGNSMFSPTVLVREERQRLEHQAGRPPVRRQVVDGRAADADVAGGRRLQPGEHAQQRRLARARRPDDGEELALGDVEVDAVDGAEACRTSCVTPAQRENGSEMPPSSMLRTRSHACPTMEVGKALARCAQGPRRLADSQPETEISRPRPRAWPRS